MSEDRAPARPGLKWWRPAAAAGLAVAVIVAVGATAIVIKRSMRPNVILLLVDALRPDYLGCYGFQGDVSPNIDALCDDATVFEEAFSAAPFTLPSVASIFTGQHALTHRVNERTWIKHMIDKKVPYGSQIVDASSRTLADVWNSVTQDALPDEAVTLAETLHDAGYATASFTHHPWSSSAVGLAQGFDLERHLHPMHRDPRSRPAERLFREAMDWIEDAPWWKPYFVWIHAVDVHSPYITEPEDVEAVEDSPSLPASRRFTKAEWELAHDAFREDIAWSDLGEKGDVRWWATQYAAGVRTFDRLFGAFMDRLRREGADRNTMIILTADHGEAFLEHGRWEHGKTLHRVQLHVPLIVRDPLSAVSVRRVAAPVSLIDVMPTILDFAGAPIPPVTDGESLLPLLRGARKSRLAEFVFASGVGPYPFRVSMEDDRYKIVRDIANPLPPDVDQRWQARYRWPLPPHGSLLFDKAADPKERVDLSTAQPAVVKRLQIEMERWADRILRRKNRSSQREATLSDEDIETLRSLGYLN